MLKRHSLNRFFFFLLLLTSSSTSYQSPPLGLLRQCQDIDKVSVQLICWKKPTFVCFGFYFVVFLFDARFVFELHLTRGRWAKRGERHLSPSFGFFFLLLLILKKGAIFYCLASFVFFWGFCQIAVPKMTHEKFS